MALIAIGKRMEETHDKELAEKLDRVLRLLAILAVKDQSQTEQIATLSRLGFPPRDIADVLGTTANTVRVALVAIRKAGRLKRRRSISVTEGRSNEKGNNQG